MSTTDTYPAFQKWWSETGHHAVWQNNEEDSAWEVWQAATEAAKATGTVGERPALTGNDVIEMIVGHLVSVVGGRNLMKGEEIGFSLDDLVFVANAAAARKPAPVAIKTWQERFTAKSRDRGMPELMRVHLERNCMMDEIAGLRAALAATAAPVRNEADERDNEIFELQKALAFWLPQVNQFMSDEMSQRIAHDAYMLVIDGNLPDDFKTAQELGWILPATGKVQRDAEMVCGNCMEPIPTTVMDTSSTRAPAAALSDESIDELAKPLMEQCVIVYGDMRRFARAIIAATRSQP